MHRRMASSCFRFDGYLGTGVQWKLTGQDGDHWLQVPWKLCTNNAEVLRDAAVIGRGIALLPTLSPVLTSDWASCNASSQNIGRPSSRCARCIRPHATSP